MSEKSIKEITPERAVQLAQLEKLQLENEKLRLELAEQRRARPWYLALIQMVPIFTAVVALAGFLWGVVQYRDQQDKNRTAQEEQSLREQATAEQEFMKPWLENQREIYLQALTAASVIANSNNPEKVQNATDEFWQLYQGKMILVETRSVSGAMVDFGHCLDGTETCGKGEMNERCRALATAMAESMAATAKMTYSQFVENQFQYR